MGIGFGQKLMVSTKTNSYERLCRTVPPVLPAPLLPFPASRELEGHGVSYCAVCDAFFYRGKDVAVLGSGEYAQHEAGELLPVVGSVTILTMALSSPASCPKAQAGYPEDRSL